MDSEKFLKTKKWQNCFNSLSNIELKIAAIFTILNCPNQTCRKSLLHKRILYYLKVRTSQNPKEEFRKSVDKIISQLISSKIFKEYNKSNEHPRIKFDKTKTEVFENYLRKYFKNQVTRDLVQNRTNTNSVNKSRIDSNISLFEQESFSPLNIDKNDALSNLIENDIESNESYETENYNDESDEDLLDRFIDDDLPELDDYIEEKPTPKTSENLKEKILTHFAQSANIRVEEDFSEIRMSLKGNVDCIIIIEIDIISNSLNCNVVIEYLSEATDSILKSMSKGYPNITFCIDEYNSKESFFLKHRIDITRFNEIEVISIIESLLKATKIVITSIEKHL